MLDNKKILVFGASGMLGHRLYIQGKLKGLDIFGTVRRLDTLKKNLNSNLLKNILSCVDAYNLSTIEKCFIEVRPDFVINCIGLVKQLPEFKDPEKSIYLNSLFPHMVARLCRKYKARLIHVSTDCVFSGKSGNYTEDDYTDADDLYGLSKLLGEVNDTNSITIRTSFIGHELETKHGLLEWFLSQKVCLKGYKNVFFSGLSTNELSRVVFDFILPNYKISGIFNISAKRISKYDLLRLIAKTYKKRIKIIPSNKPFCDRSLNSEKFYKATGYIAPEWDNIIKIMYNCFQNCSKNAKKSISK